MIWFTLRDHLIFFMWGTSGIREINRLGIWAQLGLVEGNLYVIEFGFSPMIFLFLSDCKSLPPIPIET